MASQPVEHGIAASPVSSAKESGISHVESEVGQGKSSYGDILRSSVIVGGASVITIALGIIRTKFMAVLLGPSGVGLMGLYASIASTVGTLAGMGIETSGVRQVAEATGSGDQHRVARTIIALRRAAIALGLLGTLLLLLAAKPVSQSTFGDSSHQLALALLAFTCLFGTLASGQVALIQGLCRIGDLARINILGTLAGTLIGLPIVYLVGEAGIVPMLLTVSFVTMAASWWYARSVQVHRIEIGWRETWAEMRLLLGLGSVFMVSGLLLTGVSYLVRLMIVREEGLKAAGYFQAAWVLSGLYVAFILRAMAADYYPRLSAVAKDNKACHRLVNEQTEVALLLAVPGIMATVVLAPAVIQLFYSGQFGPATAILRWQILGALLKVAVTPIGFILLAKGEGRRFIISEALSYLVYLILTWSCLRWFGLPGAGLAYFGHTLFTWLLYACVVRKFYGFVWSPSNCRLAGLALPAVAITFVGSVWLPPVWGMAVGGLVTGIVGIFCLGRLFCLIEYSRIPPVVRTILKRLGWSPSKSPGLRTKASESSAPQML